MAAASLCRARRESDGALFWSKSPSEDYPSEAMLRHSEAELRAAERQAPAACAVTRINHDRSFWLLYEGHPGEPLSLGVRGLSAFLDVAVPLVRAVEHAHAQGLFFGLLEPSCILLTDEGIRLIGAIGYDDRALVRNLVESPFAAPELNGPIEVDVTAAADIYSLGCILYQLLMGRPPLSSTSGSELERRMQSVPPLPSEQLPEPLSKLVMSMLSPSPVSRPFSACLVRETLANLDTGGHALALGAVFNLHRSVARREELATIMSVIDRGHQGEGAVLLISGEPGIGKSWLLREAKKRTLTTHRIIAECKFDQVRQGRPQGALLTAFRSAIELLVGDDDARFLRHRARFGAADRALLGVLRNELPELEHVAGRLPAPSRLGPSETEHRFKRAFRHVLEGLCDPAMPLLLVFDDLQWADRATIELLKDWRQTGLPRSLVLVCCFRREEIPLAPHVCEFLQLVEGVPHIVLERFDANDLTALCNEVIPKCSDLAALASVVHQRSDGNPLHALEVLKNLVENGELQRHQGQWHLVRVPARLSHVSDTVIDLLVARMGRFPTITRYTLMAAACVGQDFSAVLLAAALGRNVTTVTEALRRGECEGLLVALASGDDAYSFAHDRVQQAALTLSDEAFKKDVRLKLGRHYLKGAASNRQCLFSAVEYLNWVRSELTANERTELAQLNWEAALSAKESIAYERAVPLLRAFLEDAKPTEEEKRFSASLLLGECLFLSSELQGAEEALNRARAEALTPELQLRVMRTSLLLHQHRQRYEGAIASGLNALRVLGYSLPARPGLLRVLFSLLLLMFRARKVDVTQLPMLRDRTTERDREILNTLVNLWGPTFWVNQNLNALLVVHLMTLTLRLGNTPSSAMAYVCYAVLNHVLFKRYELGLQYGRIALAQLEVDGTAFVATRVRFLALTFFGAFERTPAENVSAYEEALTYCIANGELVGSHLLDGIITTLPIHGFSLATIQRRLLKYEKQARLLGADTTAELIGVVRHWQQSLADGGTDSLDAFVAVPIEYASYRGIRDLLAMQLAYLYGDDTQVLSLSKRARGDMVVQANPLHRATFCLFIVLASCRKNRRVGAEARAAYRTLRRFSRIQATNFRSFELMAEAELLAARGKIGAARERYRHTLDETARTGHELLGAVAAERLAASYDTAADQALRDECLRVAAFAYARFGAGAKVKQLKRRYPELSRWSARSDVPAAGVDMRLEAVMHAASTIAEETSTRLAPTLTRVVAMATNAERALLIQNVDEQWTVLTGWQLNAGEIVTSPVNLDACNAVSKSVVRYVCRTKSVVTLGSDDDKRFAEDPYLEQARPRSVLCVPLAHRGEVNAIIYLENSLYLPAFTAEQLKLATLLGTQAAIALTNADTHRPQVEAVQSRVNPHFLYNALSVIAELIATSPERAENVVLKLSRLYRAMLSSSVDRMVSLNEELALVRDYLELESARFGNKFAVRWHVDDDLGAVRVPSLLLQPLVENAVHHGIRRKLDSGEVSISALREGASLILGVSDDGPGWYHSTAGNGFGLRSVEKRLKLLYGGAAQLTIRREQGVFVQIRLPLVKE